MLRCDDVGWTAAEALPPPLKVPDRGLKLARQFHAAMQGRPYLGALIPAAIVGDSEAYSWLRSKPDGMTIAIHGWDHRKASDGGDEFHGRTTDECRRFVRDGRALVETITGEQVRHFVSPYNAYCWELIDALALEGFRFAWGGGTHMVTGPSGWHAQPPPYRLRRLVFVPSWAPLYGATGWRMAAEPPPLLETLPGLLDLPGLSVIVAHLPWELAHGESFDGVRKMVDLLGDRIISPQEFVSAVGFK